MNLKEAWGAVGGWIGSVFGQSGMKPEQKLGAAQMASGVLNNQYVSDQDLEELIQGTVSDCMNVRASERSVLKFVVKVHGKTDNKEATLLQDFLDTPNPLQNRIEFIEMASHHYDGHGNIFILIVFDDEDFPCEQYILPSNYVAPRFNSPDNPLPEAWQWRDGRATFSPRELIMMRRTSIKTSPYKGRGVLEESTKTLKLLDTLYKAQMNYFEKGGSPNVAIEVAEGSDISPESAQIYRNSWNERYNAVTGESNIAFIPGGGKVVNFGINEVNYPESKKDTKEDILQAFNTPLMMLGDVGDANFNNGQVGVAMFERSVVLRWGEKMALTYQTKFRELFHPFITVEVDPTVSDKFTALPSWNSPTNDPNPHQTHLTNEND